MNKLLVLALLIGQIVFAQQFPSKNISTVDGLPNNSIYSILCDSKGNVWIGTSNGIALMRGNQITNLHEEDGLAYNNCWSIEEDSNGNIWFGSYGGGLTLYNGKEFKTLNKNTGLIGNHIRKLFSYKNKIYVGTDNGLSIVDINSFDSINLAEKSKEGRFQLMDFFTYKDTVYAMTFTDGLWKVDLENQKLLYVNNTPPAAFTSYKTYDQLLISINGNSFQGRAIQRVNIEDYLNGETSDNSFGSTVFWDFEEDKRGNVYGAAEGVNFPSGGLFQILDSSLIRQNKRFNIDSHSIWSIDYDAINDNLYVGSLDKGVYIINLKQAISYYNAELFNRSELNITDLKSFQENLIVLGQNSLLVIKGNQVRKEITRGLFYNYSKRHFETKGNQFTIRYSPHFNRKKAADIEFKTLKVYEDELWISTTVGLFVLNSNYEFKDYYPLYVMGFEKISETEALIQRPYSEFYKIENYNAQPNYAIYNTKGRQNPTDVATIVSYKNKTYLASLSRGLFEYSNGEIKSFERDSIFSVKRLILMERTNESELLLANSRGDVFVAELEGGFKLRDTIENSEIIGNSVSFIKQYNDAIIIGTEKGINLLQNGTTILIDEEQGVENKIFTASDIVNDTLYLGTQNGFYSINLKQYLNTESQAPQVLLSDLQVNFKTALEGNYAWFTFQDDRITLPYNKNNISLSFLVQNHPYPNKLQFRYQLSGQSSEQWSTWTTTKTINLPYLSYGMFDLELQIKDLSSGKTYDHRLVQITINPPFWKTWWFVAIVMVTFVLLGFYLFKKRIGWLKFEEQRKAEIQKRIAETKMEALQSQMNPHFIFNAINSIQNFVIDSHTDDALLYLGQFSKLIRQTLENSSKQRITLLEEIHYIESYIEVENMRFKNRIKFDFILEDAVDMFETEVPPMLIQPFIENAFVHAFDSRTIDPKIKLRIQEIANELIVEISDNGKGFSLENKSQESKGTALARERLSYLCEDDSEKITITSILGKGTTVVLRIPLFI